MTRMSIEPTGLSRAAEPFVVESQINFPASLRHVLDLVKNGFRHGPFRSGLAGVVPAGNVRARNREPLS